MTPTTVYLPYYTHQPFPWVGLLVITSPIWVTVLYCAFAVAKHWTSVLYERLPRNYQPIYSDYDQAKQKIDSLLREAEETVRRWEK